MSPVGGGTGACDVCFCRENEQSPLLLDDTTLQRIISAAFQAKMQSGTKYAPGTSDVSPEQILGESLTSDTEESDFLTTDSEDNLDKTPDGDTYPTYSRHVTLKLKKE